MTLGKQGARGRQIYPWAIESEKQAGTQHRMGERPLLGSEVAAELGGQGSSAGRSTWDSQGHCDLPAFPFPESFALGWSRKGDQNTQYVGPQGQALQARLQNNVARSWKVDT